MIDHHSVDRQSIAKLSKNNLVLQKDLTSQLMSEETIQAKKCLEVAKLLIQADQMVKKRICRKEIRKLFK